MPVRVMSSDKKDASVPASIYEVAFQDVHINSSVVTYNKSNVPMGLLMPTLNNRSTQISPREPINELKMGPLGTLIGLAGTY